MTKVVYNSYPSLNNHKKLRTLQVGVLPPSLASVGLNNKRTNNRERYEALFKD